jgi:hypothetical protein
MPLWRSLVKSGAAGDDDDTASTGTDELMIVLLEVCIYPISAGLSTSQLEAELQLRTLVG